MKPAVALLWAAGVAVADQATKWLVVTRLFDHAYAGQTWYLTANQARPVTGFFNWVLVGNTGISFSLLSGTDLRYGLIAMTALVIAFLVVWLFRGLPGHCRLAIAGIVGGAAGNLTDRVRFGAVVDFLDFHAYGYHWPAFNLADSAIVCGVMFLLFDGLRKRPPAAGG